MKYLFNEAVVIGKVGVKLYDFLYVDIGLDDKDANKVVNTTIVTLIQELRKLNESR